MTEATHEVYMLIVQHRETSDALTKAAVMKSNLFQAAISDAIRWAMRQLDDSLSASDVRPKELAEELCKYFKEVAGVEHTINT